MLRSMAIRHRNGTACRYYDAEVKKIGSSNASLILMKAAEVPARIDETGAPFGATRKEA